MLIALAWRNIWRQPRRTILSLVTIAFAAAAAIFISSLQRGGYSEVEQNALHLIDGYAQIQPAGYSSDPDLRKVIVNPDTVTVRTDHVPGITASAPRAGTYAIISLGDRSFGAEILGVDPAREPRISSLHSTIIKGRYLLPGDSNSVVLGAGLARNLRLGVGATVTILGAASDGSVAADVLKVVGIFSTGVPKLDHQFIEVPLRQFQSVFATGNHANVIAVSGRSLESVQMAVPNLHAIASQSGLVVRDWTDLEPALHDAILIDEDVSHVCYISLLIIIVFIILNTLLMSVLERTREFGMLMAIGMRPDQIGRMIWIELLFLTAIGISIGMAAGVSFTLWDAQHGIHIAGAEALFAQWHMPAAAYPKLTLRNTFLGPLEIALGIIIAGLVPYRRVLRLQPIAATRAT
jgi:putative ABC transport system permease protein